MRLRSSLILLVVGTVLPVAAFALYVSTLVVRHEQEQFFSAVQARNRAFMSAVEAELKGHITTLQALSALRSLRDDNLGAFHEDAVAALRTQSDWENLILNAPEGRQLVNAALPFGASLPDATDMQTVVQAARSGKPLVVDLRERPLTNTYAVPVRVPVVRDGKVVYVLTAVIRPETFQRLLVEQHLPAEWTSGLADGEKRFIARIPPRPVASPITPFFAKALEQSPDGWYRGETSEGVDSFTTFSKGTLTNWAIGVAIPKDVVFAGAVRASTLMLAAAMFCVLAAGLVALYVGRRIALPISHLAASVEGIESGAAFGVISSNIDEVQELAAALKKSATAVAERHRLEQQQRSVLETADRSKDEFLAMLSHELRNPLAAIMTASQLMKLSRPGSDVSRKAQDIVERQAQQVNRLIDDLLDVSKIAAGKANLNMEPIDLAQLAAGLVETWRTSGRLAKHVATVETNGAAWTVGDRARIEQVIANLLDNAVKFSPAGTAIQLAVDTQEARVRLVVADHGRGLTPIEMERIFGLFVQGQQDLDRTAGGLGIGLAVVKRLVELHGGTITVMSEGLGKGSRFVLQLPEAPPPPGESARPDNSMGSRCAKVLVVEDNDDAREGLRELLTILGHEVRDTASSREALAIVDSGWPECALLDIGLPEIDGYQLAGMIRQRAPSVRLIAVTGYGQPSDRQQALAAGFEHHLVKPVTHEVLSEVLAGVRS